MNGARVCLWTLLCALAAVLWSSTGIAQSAPQIRIEVDQDTVGVGDVFAVVMNVTSAETMPGDPRLGPTPGFNVRGQNESPTQTHISINGNRSDRYTLTVQWALQAQRPGTFTLGPASIAVGSARLVSRRGCFTKSGTGASRASSRAASVALRSTYS